MAMGQCTSPNGPESAVLAGLVYQICELYIDDVLIHGRDLESFLYIVLKVFEMSQVNQAKIKLRLAEVEYVGHVISATGITFMEEKRLKKYKGSGKLVWSLRVLSASNQELYFFEDTANLYNRQMLWTTVSATMYLWKVRVVHFFSKARSGRKNATAYFMG